FIQAAKVFIPIAIAIDVPYMLIVMYLCRGEKMITQDE
nr:hypothetical protein [Tanacetum cinerariifolium]